MKRLWPEVKLAIGPSIDNGFYYDLDSPFAITPEHMEQIEAEMRKICKEKIKLERFELPREEAVKLMEEMEKIRRVIDREYPEATMRCLLVVDATTGQNGLVQAKAFREAAGINGIVLTKLDGTAKGGIAFPIVRELGVPVMYVGVGEGIEDLQSFNAQEFVDALFE